MTNETKQHLNLKENSKKILKKKGYSNIKTEHKIKRYIVDVIGFDKNKIGIIECGSCSKKKISNLRKIKNVEMVLHIRFKKERGTKTHIIKLTNKNNKKLQEIKKENDLKNVDNTLNFILDKYELKESKK